ncbi:hypothetical protein ATANTOWER_024742 [Ataeniobius toweri]|uniref:Uncharacterized protein n=1 Tax=Ataeniobius toweri TaxID=208326 RepID=A0ABU7BL29_9TELE|nr:hypothetical protein [Ataeniobius toweri]
MEMLRRTCHLPTMPKVPTCGLMTMESLLFFVQQTHLTCTPKGNLKSIVIRKRKQSRPNNPDKQKVAVKQGFCSVMICWCLYFYHLSICFDFFSCAYPGFISCFPSAFL